MRSIILIFVALSTIISERATGITALPAGAPLPAGVSDLLEVTDGNGNILDNSQGNPMFATDLTYPGSSGFGFNANPDSPPQGLSYASPYVSLTVPGTPRTGILSPNPTINRRISVAMTGMEAESGVRQRVRDGARSARCGAV